MATPFDESSLSIPAINNGASNGARGLSPLLPSLNVDRTNGDQANLDQANLDQANDDRANDTPLIAAIADRLARLRDRAHVPGHQGRPGDRALAEAWGPGVWQWDLTELAGLDNLAAPSGPIAAAQAEAAAAVGAAETWFLVNGSTGGILAAILATVGDGETILMARNVHQSAIAALILSGAQPVWLPVPIEPDWAMAGPIEPTTIAAALAQHPEAKAVFVVSPTYYGLTSDLAAIAAIAHGHGLPLIVDGAHGAHFGRHRGLPAHAIATGADLVIESTHKTLGGLTQAAMLHRAPGALGPASERLRAALRWVQSSSPSYLLLASLDGARRSAGDPGSWQRTIDLAQSARDRLGALAGVRVLNQPGQDPLRLTFTVAGRSAYDLDDWLDRDHGLAIELADSQNLVLVLTPYTDPGLIDRLITAMAQLPAHQPPEPTTQPTPIAPPPEPIAVLSPRQAARAPQTIVPLAEAIGHVAATWVCPYPPGIPLLVPGERVTPAAIDQVRSILAAGGDVVGLGAIDPDPTADRSDSVLGLAIVTETESASPIAPIHVNQSFA